MDLDRFDRQLLNLVQIDATQTAEEMAQIVALSPSAIQRRLRRLRELGVIRKDVAVIDPARVGKTTTFIAAVQVERERPEHLAQLKKWIADHDQVQEAFYVTGEADFILVVIAQDAESYETMMSHMVSENPNVKKFTTNVALGSLKRSLAVPISLDNE